MNIFSYFESQANTGEWDELYNPNGDNPLRGFKQRRAKGRDGEWKLFTPPMGKAGSLDASNKNYEKNLKLQGNYLTNSFNAYKNDVKGYDKKLADWNTNNNKYKVELDKLEVDFKKLGNVDKNSSKERVDAYNGLIRSYENIIERSKSNDPKINSNGGLNNVREQLTGLQTSLNARFDDLMGKSKKFENISMASDALGLNYDFGEALSLSLEGAFADIGVLATGTVSALAEVSRLLPGDQQEMEFYEHINNSYKASINYNESVKEKKQTSILNSCSGTF